MLSLGLFVHSKQLDSQTNCMRFKRNTTWFSDFGVTGHSRKQSEQAVCFIYGCLENENDEYQYTYDMRKSFVVKKKQIFATSEALNFAYRSLPGNVCSVLFDERSYQSISYSLVSMKMWVLARHGVPGLRAQSRNLGGQCLKRFCQSVEEHDNAGLISYERRVLLEMLDQKQLSHSS
jgi:hypothetical protein